MITNTCLTGGSFVADPPPADPDDRLPAPEDPLCVPDEPPLELDGACAWVVFALAAGTGVGSGSAAGGSLPEAADSGSVAEAEPEAGAPDGAEAGSTTFRGERADASVSFTAEPAASPRIAPKPRNTSTSSAEIRGEGSLKPEGARAGPLATGAVVESRGGAPARCARPTTRRRSGSSNGLREPTRAPQPRQ